MRKLAIFLLLVCIGFSHFSEAKPVAPTVHSPAAPVYFPRALASKIMSMKVKDVEKITGKKMSLKEKIAFGIVKHRMKKEMAGSKDEKKKSKGKTALILGIIGLGVLFIPYLTLAALPCGILAIVFGNEARREDPTDRKARTGVLLGWITVALFVVALIIVIAVLSSWAFAFE